MDGVIYYARSSVSPGLAVSAGPPRPIANPSPMSQRRVGVRVQMRFVSILFVFMAVAGGSAWADACPGNPDALSTSRELTISPSKFSEIGSMQYKQSLPLNDHEVVLTFDDGPLPPYSNIILDTLASHVKATYFLIGRMAHQYPSMVRRMST